MRDELARRKADRVQRVWAAERPASALSWDDLEPTEMMGQVESWLDSEPLGNLILAGSVGTGETALAVAAMDLLVEDGMTCRVTRLSSLLDAARARVEDPTRWGHLVRADVLLVDDATSVPLTDWGRGQVHDLLDDRMVSGPATICTANVQIGDTDDRAVLAALRRQLVTGLGEPAFDRLRHGATTIVLSGQSRRSREVEPMIGQVTFRDAANRRLVLFDNGRCRRVGVLRFCPGPGRDDKCRLVLADGAGVSAEPGQLTLLDPEPIELAAQLDQGT